MECSARTCEGVKEIFEEAVRIMVRKDYKGPNGMFIGSKLRQYDNSYIHSHAHMHICTHARTRTRTHTECLLEVSDCQTHACAP